jgi:hypothetical protein
VSNVTIHLLGSLGLRFFPLRVALEPLVGQWRIGWPADPERMCV